MFHLQYSDPHMSVLYREFFNQIQSFNGMLFPNLLKKVNIEQSMSNGPRNIVNG